MEPVFRILAAENSPIFLEFPRPLGIHHHQRGDLDTAGESVPNLRIAERRKGQVRWITRLPGQPPLTPGDSLMESDATTLFNGRQPLVLGCIIQLLLLFV